MKTKQVKATTPALVFQQALYAHEVLISNGNTSYWADGVEGSTLVDVKYAAESNSIYRGEATDFITKQVAQATVNQFEKVKELLATTSFTKFKIVVNDELIIGFFAAIADIVELEVEFEVKNV